MYHHPSPHRVQFNVSVTTEKIVFFSHETGAKPPFPEGTGTPIGPVYVLHISLAQMFHHSGRPLALLRCHQEVNVVGHQHVGMQVHRILLAGLTEMIEVELVIVFS